MWLLLVAMLVQQPSFNQYPAPDRMPAGQKPAVPILATARQRLYRTMIREGAKQGPNFAGHYTIAGWGCGSSCAGFAIVDAITGKTFDTPFKYYEMEEISYNLNSRLLILKGCPEEENCGTYHYEWTGSQLKLLKKIPAVPQ